MENLTNQEIDQLLTLADAATPGPWTAWEGQTSVFYGTAEKNSSREYLPSGNDLLEICQTDNCREEDTEDVQPADPADDAAYIAAANPTTLRRLLLELQQHRATAATGAAGEAGGATGASTDAELLQACRAARYVRESEIERNVLRLREVDGIRDFTELLGAGEAGEYDTELDALVADVIRLAATPATAAAPRCGSGCGAVAAGTPSALAAAEAGATMSVAEAITVRNVAAMDFSAWNDAAGLFGDDQALIDYEENMPALLNAFDALAAALPPAPTAPPPPPAHQTPEQREEGPGSTRTVGNTTATTHNGFSTPTTSQS